jgi:hypothetical protein
MGWNTNMSDLVIQKTEWFPTEVFSTKIDESVCNRILTDIDKDKDHWDKGLKFIEAKTTGWNGLKEYKVIQELSNYITDSILPKIGEACKWKYNNWTTYEAWINFYEKKDSGKIHCHGIADYSAVLIVQPGDGNLTLSRTGDMLKLRKRFELNIEQKINEEKGTLILFPSWLYHFVEKCEKERVTVAFNFINNSRIN